MLEKYLDAIKETIRLANQRESVPSLIEKDSSKNFVESVIDLGDTVENPEYQKIDRELMEYLYSLDYECIHIMEILMFIGRGDCDKSLSGEALFLDMKEYVDNHLGFGNKEAEVVYISEKSPLGRYLENGIKLVCG